MKDIKSQRAKEWINNTHSLFEFYSDDPCPYMTISGTYRAIEIAEQDGRERAVRAFKMACEWYDDGRDCCWRCPTDPQRKCERSHCADYDKFLKRYDNDSDMG